MKPLPAVEKMTMVEVGAELVRHGIVSMSTLCLNATWSVYAVYRDERPSAEGSGRSYADAVHNLLALLRRTGSPS